MAVVCRYDPSRKTYDEALGPGGRWIAKMIDATFNIIAEMWKTG